MIEFDIALLKRNKTRTVSGTNTRPTVLDRLVGQGELAQVETDHLRLDFDLKYEKNICLFSKHRMFKLGKQNIKS